MKAFGFLEHGGIDKALVWEAPEPPAPGPGEVRVSIIAAAFNRLDLFTLQGLEGVEVPRPHILCGDASGIVEEVGEGVPGVRKGDRVLVNPGLSDGTCAACRAGREMLCRHYRILGEHLQGLACERAVVPARNLLPLPDNLDPVEAAGVPLVFMTAWRALRDVGELRAGERVAIIGAGGGLSTAAIQIAAEAGGRVLVASRSREKAERTRPLGAQDVLEIRPDVPLSQALWEASGKEGFPLIFDCTGKETFPSSARALARGGRLVFCGATTGPRVEIDLRPLFWRNASLRGSTMGSRENLRQALDRLAKGRLRPVVDSVHPLEQGARGLLRLQSGEVFGKVILRVSG